MSYENAPATRMLATHCAVCARPLVDAVSVDLGMGPDCRKKHGFIEGVDPEAWKRANRLIHEIALMVSAQALSLVRLQAASAELRLVGFDRLADVLLYRNAKIRITEEGAFLRVHTPYEATFGTRLRAAMPGHAAWAADEKCWHVSATCRNTLWRLLKECFPGVLGVSAKGTFNT